MLWGGPNLHRIWFFPYGTHSKKDERAFCEIQKGFSWNGYCFCIFYVFDYDILMIHFDETA